MSESTGVGSIAWTDLSVPEAGELKEFYQRVVGWKSDPVDMGGYSDFSMIPPSGDAPVAGICHAKGVNAELPPVWLVYIVVENLEKSLAACAEGGGRILAGRKSTGPGSAYAVIQDPAGAVSALYQVGS